MPRDIPLSLPSPPAAFWLRAEAPLRDARPPEVLQEGCEPCPGDADLRPEDLSGPCPWERR